MTNDEVSDLYTLKVDGKILPKANDTENGIIDSARKLSKYGRCLVEVYTKQEKKLAVFLKGRMI